MLLRQATDMKVSSLCILIPCLNEERGVASVVREYRNQFPQARIVVVDNGSTDATGRLAREAGAEVLIERSRGKARAVLRAFSNIDSDILIMVDGDDSYPAAGAQRLLDQFLKEGPEMVTGIRRPINGQSAFRPFHQAGTSAFSQVLCMVFGFKPSDVFSGLRLFSRRFYKNVPIHSRGFELEMELTIQAIDKGFTTAEIDVPFRDRAQGSHSKLRTVQDGLRILKLLVILFRDYKPFVFFSGVSSMILAAGLVAGMLPVYEYFTTGMVGRFPMAILAAALCNLAAFTLFTGLILESNLRHHREAYQLELRRFEDSGQAFQSNHADRFHLT